MNTNNKSINLFAEAFGLPIINDGTHVWFFRTESGLYYYDFYLNNYIALGWDLLSKDFANDIKKNEKEKKAEISKVYPDEQRPGLIWGQMDTFYNKMKKGDIVVIPATGGKEIVIGMLDEISTSISHVVSDDEYAQCTYKHKRTVSWFKKVDLWTDVYLSKVLRAQQTISDITKYEEMVYRNLHPYYISSQAIHLTMQKTTDSDYNIEDNIAVQSAVIQISKLLSEYFEIQTENSDIKIKTAVGSPGFLEILFPTIPVSIIVGACIFRTLVGKTKNDSGEIATGIMAIISKGNDLLNDHLNRKKITADIEQIKASTRKTDAETAKIQAETAKIQAESNKLPPLNTTDMILVAEVSRHCAELKSAAERSGIKIEKQLEKI